jgi:hypothetical protein
VDSYVVRVYRREGRDPYGLIGVVESGVEEKGKRAFRNAGELLGIISGRKSGPSVERRAAGRLRLRLPLTVEWTGPGGRRFDEDTTLEDLSPGGAYFFLENCVAGDARLKVLIDPERSGLEVRGRVVRLDEGSGKSGVGVVFEIE